MSLMVSVRAVFLMRRSAPEWVIFHSSCAATPTRAAPNAYLWVPYT